MSRRFQFTLRALLVAIVVVTAFFGGIRFERERRQVEADQDYDQVRRPFSGIVEIFDASAAVGRTRQ